MEFLFANFFKKVNKKNLKSAIGCSLREKRLRKNGVA